MHESPRLNSENGDEHRSRTLASAHSEEGDRDRFPGVFVITACMNSERTIADTLESVLRQSDRLTRYMIIDGGSTDSTLAIVDRYVAGFGEKLSVVSEPDQGIYDAMNKGVRLCLAEAEESDLIATLNSDDRYEPNALEIVREAARSSPGTDVFFGDVAVLDTSGHVTGKVRRSVTEVTRESSFDGMPVEHSTMFVRARVYSSLGLYDESLSIAADYDFVLRLLDRGVSFKHVGSVLTGFRVGGISTSLEPPSFKEAIRVRIAHGASPSFEWARYYKRRVTGRVFSLLRWIPGVAALQSKYGASSKKVDVDE